MQNCNCNNCISGATIGKCGFFCKLTKSKLFKIALIAVFPVAGTLFTVVDAINEIKPKDGGGNTDNGGGSGGAGGGTSGGGDGKKDDFEPATRKKQLILPNTF